MLQDVSHLSKAELIAELDEMIIAIKQAENDPAVILYNDMRNDAGILTDALKRFVPKDGAFQTKYIAFQKIETNNISWKDVCAKLYKDKRINDDDVLPFQKPAIQVRAMKIKEGSSEMNVQS